jgi:hypothetical protein
MSGYVSGKTSLTTVQTGNIAANAVTLAKLASGTDGNLITYDASGDPAAVATGSDGEVLTSAGAGQPPAFEAASSGLEFVSTAAISAATTLAITSLAAGYDYIITLEAFAPTDDVETFWMRFSDDNGVSYEAGAADYQWSVSISGSGQLDNSAAQIGLSGANTLGNDATLVSTIEIILHNPNASSEITTCAWSGFYMDSGATPEVKTLTGGARFLQGTDAVDAVQFLWSGGSTFKAQGDILVWRRKRS